MSKASHTARASKKTAVILILAYTLGACSLFSGRENGSQYADDTAITAKVKEAFIADPQIKSMEVNVETMQSVVQLSGFVDSSSMEARAVRIARHISGVKDVQDNITIRATH